MSLVNTSQTVSRLASMLGVDQNSNSIGVNNSQSAGTPSSVEVAQAVELNDADSSHTLVLKDRLEGGAHLLSMVSIDDTSLDTIGVYLNQMKTNLSQANTVDSGSEEYAEILRELETIENQMSNFLGALFHKNEISVELRSGDENAKSLFWTL